MCTVCPVLHCIGNHLNALHAFDHLNDYPMASSNSDLAGYGNHDPDAEEEADDVFKCRSKTSSVDADTSDKSMLIKRRRQFYYNHVHSIYSQIWSKKIATERKSHSTCKPTLLSVLYIFNFTIFKQVLATENSLVGFAKQLPTHASFCYAVILIVLSGLM
jgi:hypothetical protein